MKRLFVILGLIALAGCSASETHQFAGADGGQAPLAALAVLTSDQLPAGKDCVFDMTPDHTKAALACRKNCTMTFIGVGKDKNVSLVCPPVEAAKASNLPTYRY